LGCESCGGPLLRDRNLARFRFQHGLAQLAAQGGAMAVDLAQGGIAARFRRHDHALDALDEVELEAQAAGGDTMDYDPAKRRLKIGKGYVDNITPEMWEYEVSGKQVLWHWFSYRRRDRSRPIIGDRRPPSPLGSIQPEGWLAEYTTDLLDLLHVLGRLIALEPAQADLLNRICAGPLRSAEELREAGAFTNADEKSASSKIKSKSKG
jgi:hypothetical protein